MIQKLQGDSFFKPESQTYFARHSSSCISTIFHCHDFFEIFLVSNGRVTHEVNGKGFELEKGHLVFIRPDDSHRYISHKEDKTFKLLNLAFTVSLFEQLEIAMASEGFFKNLSLHHTSPTVRLSSEKTNLLIQDLERAEESKMANPILASGMFKSLIVSIMFTHFTEFCGISSHDGKPSWLRDLRLTMSRRHHFKHGLSFMRRYANCSPEHLNREFKKFYNQTPTEYINALRLDYAADRLLNSNADIQEVTLDAGFENLSHFYHLFKKKFHTSPAKFRKNSRCRIVPVGS